MLVHCIDVDGQCPRHTFVVSPWILSVSVVRLMTATDNKGQTLDVVRRAQPVGLVQG